MSEYLVGALQEICCDCPFLLLSSYSFIIPCLSSVPHASPYPTLIWLVSSIDADLQIARNS